jgi:hypothetical protein
MNTFEKMLTRAVAASPQKSPSKCSPSKKPSFLRKDSMLTDFTAWDVDDRLHEVEAQFRALKDVMNSSLTDRKSQDEALELAKTRSKCALALRLYRCEKIDITQ